MLLTPAATLRSPAAELSDRPVALHGEALNHPLLRYPALLRGRGLFAAKVDLVQRRKYTPSIVKSRETGRKARS